jgi:hypothetical protein
MSEGKKDLAAVEADVVAQIASTQAKLKKLEELLDAIREQAQHNAK